jgi:hypothetical protein
MDTAHMKKEKMLLFAVNSDVIVFSLSGHSAHFLQPVDYTFFMLLKMFNHGACKMWMLKKETRNITHLQYGELLSQPWARAAVVGKSISGFLSHWNISL